MGLVLGDGVGKVVDAELGDLAGDVGFWGGFAVEARVAVDVEPLSGAQAAYGALSLPVVLADFMGLDAGGGVALGLLVVAEGVLAGVVVVFNRGELAVVFAAKFEVGGGAGAGDGFGFVVVAGEGEAAGLQAVRSGKCSDGVALLLRAGAGVAQAALAVVGVVRAGAGAGAVGEDDEAVAVGGVEVVVVDAPAEAVFGEQAADEVECAFAVLDAVAARRELLEDGRGVLAPLPVGVGGVVV